MSGISVNVYVLLIKGIPECLLAVLALHIFTRTKIDPKKYILLSAVHTLASYLVRFLPIALGVNSILALLVMIITFQFAYKTQLSKVIRTIISAAVIYILVVVSEVLNMFLLIIIFDKITAENLMNSTNGLTQSISSLPSTVFFAIFVFVGYLIMRKTGNRKKVDGEASGKTGA